MEIMDYFNLVLLFLTISYGFAFGIKNVLVKLRNPLKEINQQDLGKFMDSMFIVLVLYFTFIVDIVALFEKIK